MLKVAPVSTKKLSPVRVSFKKIKPAFVGNDIAVATWTLLSAGGCGGSADFLVFRYVARGDTSVGLCPVVVMKFARTVVWVLEIAKTDVSGAIL